MPCLRSHHPSTCGLVYMVIAMGFPAEGDNRSWSNKICMSGRFPNRWQYFGKEVPFPIWTKVVHGLVAACFCILPFPTPGHPPTSPVTVFLPFLLVFTPCLFTPIPVPLHFPPTPVLRICPHIPVASHLAPFPLTHGTVGVLEAPAGQLACNGR